MNHVTSLLTPIGPMLLIATERGLESAIFTNDDPSTYLKSVDREGAEKAFMAPYVDQLTEYFAGTRREFTFPLDLHGTDFQIATWYALRNIPYGQMRTYAQIADLIGRPKGARALAQQTMLIRWRLSFLAIVWLLRWV